MEPKCKGFASSSHANPISLRLSPDGVAKVSHLARLVLIRVCGCLCAWHVVGTIDCSSNTYELLCPLGTYVKGVRGLYNNLIRNVGPLTCSDNSTTSTAGSQDGTSWSDTSETGYTGIQIGYVNSLLCSKITRITLQNNHAYCDPSSCSNVATSVTVACPKVGMLIVGMIVSVGATHQVYVPVDLVLTCSPPCTTLAAINGAASPKCTSASSMAGTSCTAQCTAQGGGTATAYCTSLGAWKIDNPCVQNTGEARFVGAFWGISIHTTSVRRLGITVQYNRSETVSSTTNLLVSLADTTLR